MNSADKSKLDAAVSSAASVANFNEATHVRHVEQLIDETNRALTQFGKQELNAELKSAWHTYNTNASERVVYGLEFLCASTQDLPKSPAQIRDACSAAGLRVDEVDYNTATQKYRVELKLTGQAATRRSRRLRDEDPAFKLDESAVPAKIARQLGTSMVDPDIKEEAGIARTPAVKAIKISSKNRFSSRRRSPKKVLKRRVGSGAAAKKSGLSTWFSYSGWFGGETSEDKEVVSAYQDDQGLFAY